MEFGQGGEGFSDIRLSTVFVDNPVEYLFGEGKNPGREMGLGYFGYFFTSRCASFPVLAHV